MPSALSQCAPCNSIQTHKIHFPKYQIHICKNWWAFGNTKSTVWALGAFSIADSQFGGLHNLPNLGVDGNDVYEDLEQSFYVGLLPRWWLWLLLNLGCIGWLWAWQFWNTSFHWTNLNTEHWTNPRKWWNTQSLTLVGTFSMMIVRILIGFHLAGSGGQRMGF